MNGRQVGDIRQDHLERYLFAKRIINYRNRQGGIFLDAACGVGYGSKILADVASTVHAYDIAPEAIELAYARYAHPRVKYHHEDVTTVSFPTSDVAVSFETIEHLKEPALLLSRLRQSADLLIASVPNEDLLPFDPKRHRYHVRHYKVTEFVALLNSCGWRVDQIYYQEGKLSPVVDAATGTTIVVTAR